MKGNVMQRMQIKKIALSILVGCQFSHFQVWAANKPLEKNETSAVPAGKETIKYRAGAAINFDEMLIQGQLKRPELNVIVGNASEGTDGLLRLRENFNDQTQIDIGEEIQ